jgi:BirA family biotin operon repressor/biotin-[acetyl-CoA-carboxylase] ligase
MSSNELDFDQEKKTAENFEKEFKKITQDKIPLKVEVIKETESSNAIAFELLQNEKHVAVITDHQKAGKGRRGRQWKDVPGHSLLVSFGFREEIPVLSWIPLYTGLVTHQALSLWMEDVDLKWPNDLYLNGKKCGGILSESRPLTDPKVKDTHRAVVVGVGINYDEAPEIEFSDNEPSVTPTFLKSAELNLGTRKEVLLKISQMFFQNLHLLRSLDGLRYLKEKWLEVSKIKGKRIEILGESKHKPYQVLGLDDDGSLIVQDTKDYHVRVLRSEEISVR